MDDQPEAVPESTPATPPTESSPESTPTLSEVEAQEATLTAEVAALEQPAATPPEPASVFVDTAPVLVTYQAPSYEVSLTLPIQENGRWWFSGSQHLVPAKQVADLLEKLSGFQKVVNHV